MTGIFNLRLKQVSRGAIGGDSYHLAHGLLSNLLQKSRQSEAIFGRLLALQQGQHGLRRIEWISFCHSKFRDENRMKVPVSWRRRGKLPKQIRGGVSIALFHQTLSQTQAEFRSCAWTEGLLQFLLIIF